jgi:hypothetical protein
MTPRINVVHYEVADTLVATSPDIPGLVVEAKTCQELVQGVSDFMNMMKQTRANDRIHQPCVGSSKGDIKMVWTIAKGILLAHLILALIGFVLFFPLFLIIGTVASGVTPDF